MSTGGDALTAVNQQILSAVETANHGVLGAAGKQASAMLAQMASQALGMAIQDGVDHLQQMLTLDTAVTGKALAIIVGGGNDQAATEAMAKATAAVASAIQDLEQIGAAVGRIIGDLGGT